MKHFDVKDLIDSAKQSTGLSDLGEPDFMENLEMFIKAVNEGQGISDDKWDASREYYTRLLKNRLWFAKDLSDHPEILDEEIKPPVIILPQPRTGSTKLHRMLGASNSFQDLLWWHMHMMSRIPGKENGGVAERIKATQEFEQWSLAASPNMAKGHPPYALITEEEQMFHEMTFWSLRLAIQSSAASWHFEWLAENGAAQAYDFLLKQLKYAQWQHYPNSTKPWLLKSPTNVGQEEQLTRIFGKKIKVISTHRNPVNVICSIAEVANHYRQIFSDIKTAEIGAMYGQAMLAGFSEAAKQNLKWRDANPDIEVLDVSFDDVNNNAPKVLKEVYEYLDIELTPDIESNIKSWENDKSKNKYIKNVYSLERFGLTEKEVHEAYAPYIERFSDYLTL